MVLPNSTREARSLNTQNAEHHGESVAKSWLQHLVVQVLDQLKASTQLSFLREFAGLAAGRHLISVRHEHSGQIRSATS